MRVDGACHCGAITFEARVDPARIRVCHCTDCQTLSGSAFRVTAPTPEADFRLLTGTPKLYVKTADSGARRVQAFCGDCGTPIYATSEGGGNRKFGVRVGTLRQRADLVPDRQFWIRSKLPWLPDLPGAAVDRQ
jgi:hypothetical protein